jgi:hemoglobin/transferrin/lactoferrin receptor protein
VQGDKLTLKGSYWESDVQNLIDLGVVGVFANGPADNGCYTGGDCYSQYINTPNAELDGIEIALDYDTTRWFFGLGYSSIDGKDQDTGEFVGILQPDKLIVNAGIKVPEWWARFGTRLTFADEFDKVNNPEAIRDAYSLIDLYAVFEPTEGPLKGLRLDVGVDNVTDEDYQVSAVGAPEPGINYKAAVGWTYKW